MLQEKIMIKKFERIDDARYEYHLGYQTAQIALDLGKTAMLFSRVERAPRYADGVRENDAEHSFMLALVAPEIAKALDLDLDIGLVSQFAVVHDLIEVKTGDVPTFLFTENSQLQKELNEQAALRELMDELPPHTAALLYKYEQQAEPESRFVRYIDKLLPVVIDIVGSGKRVMAEDYDVNGVEALKQCQAELHDRLVKKFGGEFPEIDLAHQLLCELFEATYNHQNY